MDVDMGHFQDGGRTGLHIKDLSSASLLRSAVHGTSTTPGIPERRSAGYGGDSLAEDCGTTYTTLTPLQPMCRNAFQPERLQQDLPPRHHHQPSMPLGNVMGSFMLLREDGGLDGGPFFGPYNQPKEPVSSTPLFPASVGPCFTDGYVGPGGCHGAHGRSGGSLYGGSPPSGYGGCGTQLRGYNNMQTDSEDNNTFYRSDFGGEMSPPVPRPGRPGEFQLSKAAVASQLTHPGHSSMSPMAAFSLPYQHHPQPYLQPRPGCPPASPPGQQGGDGGEEINTREVAQRVMGELKRYSIPQSVFAERVLCRSQGTLSDLLRNPKPWGKLKSGRDTFKRMSQWLQEPEYQRMASLRLEACKRKGHEDERLERNQGPKRTRLVFTDLQRRTLLAIFRENRRPPKDLQVSISKQLCLELTTVSNFFMNARRRNLDSWTDEGHARPSSTGSTVSCSTA
ncbi:hypothetical protein DPEC_G00202840 [Dallia pectoralis]|uniref:Uncharacterized protein n=1 Tax=Dallia pectoralis TaxID=75939 RepID=A0ACC2G9Q2_DALPE|nr:hypothetical protein DPEC_G00202840 [Dallia pectoralis]